MDLQRIDAVALFCDNSMVDYVSYGIDGEGGTDVLQQTGKSVQGYINGGLLDR